MKLNYVSVIAWPLMVAAAALAGGETPEWTLARQLTADRLARHIGDLLTIEIEEESSATMDAKHSTDKSVSMEGSASFSHVNVDNHPTTWTNVSLPSFNAEASREFSGQGSLENKGTLTGFLTVRVTDVLPNHALLVEGTRTLVVQSESLTFTLTGTVRTEDIGSDNVIKSSRVGDLTIRYQANGSIAKSQKKGWVSSLVDWLNPF